MNFEKLILKNKKNILLVLAVVLVIFFVSIPNKVNFLYTTPLGRAYLISLLIIITSFNRYLGLISIIIIISIYNTTDTLVENMENATTSTTNDSSTTDSSKTKEEEKKEDPTITGAIAAKFGLEPKKEDTKKDKPVTVGEKVERESFMQRPKESSSLMSTIFPSTIKHEPRANWGGKAAYNLGFAPLNS
jgi:hypothetical protein